MKNSDDVRADSLEILIGQARQGAISRRHFLGALAALGIAAGTPAHARAKRLVIADWGGATDEAFMSAWGRPYQDAHGVDVVSDVTGPSIGRIKAMVESRAVTWDLCDSNAGESEYLGENKLVEEVDYSIVNPANVFPDAKFRWGVSSYYFSYVLAYDTEKVKAPESWADFWNLKDFPGKRALRKNVTGMCECAMLADGVAPDKVYEVLSSPGGIERAMEKFREIRDHVIFWNSGAQSADLLRNHEVVMANIWSTRASTLKRDSAGKITWTWNGGLLVPSVWVVPRGNPAGPKAAFEFANYALTPENQIALLKATGNGPSNPAAAPMVPDDLKFYDPSQPEHRKVQIPLSTAWYAKFQDRARDQYLEMQSA